jgi:hypothetical protein
VTKGFLAFTVSGLLTWATMMYGAIRAPAQQTTTTSQEQQEQCAHQAQSEFERRIADRSLYSFTSHYSAESGKCVVEIDYKKEVDKKLYDANQHIGLGQLRLLPNGSPAVCWVADLAGLHKECTSITAYGELLKKYYGM